MANISGLITQPKSHEWETPQPFFDMLDQEFGFTLDAAASSDNAKCLIYYDAHALDLPWDGVVWCNPPYGNQIGKWVEKGYRESKRGSVVVMLIPSRTETAYWHDYVMRAAEIRFIRGRLHFGGKSYKGHNAPFPSAVVIFRGGWKSENPVVLSIGRGPGKE